MVLITLSFASEGASGPCFSISVPDLGFTKESSLDVGRDWLLSDSLSVNFTFKNSSFVKDKNQKLNLFEKDFKFFKKLFQLFLKFEMKTTTKCII